MAKREAIDLTTADGLDNEQRARLLGIIDQLRELGITSEFGCQEFGNIFDEAASCMGVPGPKTIDFEKLDKRFSGDILKVELSGPNHRHLSVVDVPGLFHNATKFQTEEDRAIIRKLIEDYITDGRTIILAVMDARNNLANQEVFSMARAADPAGKRTVGIITKCDALQEGDEDGVLRIAQNQVEKLTHGWFAVRNRSTKEINEGVTVEGRHRIEKDFFAQAHPWKSLQKNRVGIDALKGFLGHLLYDHIRSEFPAVIKDIEGLSSETEKDLELLGLPRQSASDQRRFLMRLVCVYQSQVHKALHGNYDEALDAQSPLKLRMHVRKLNDQFALLMSRKGHAKLFRTIQGKIDSDFKRQEQETQNIYEWIRGYYVDSRGPELPGIVNPVVIENMFRQQSSPWEALGKIYLGAIADLVCAFNTQVLKSIVPDDEVRENLRAFLSPREQENKHQALDCLQRILNDERGGVLQTVNHYYADTLSSIRRERVLARLEGLGFNDGVPFDTEKVLKSVHLSNDDQAVYDIHDMLKAYYKVAIKRFTDNIVMQVTERHILGDDGPVKVLSPDLIGSLTELQLAELAGESFMTASRRNDLTAKAERFRKALDVARVAVM
ncbi:hypothetical protein N7541_008050 [Penicillium brevicompactum]|uniref:GED domain-containing protein n=1 Tax=Penicillium brevicompactum TaxID=5074 RepID=A0A9W9R3Y2_PENBR|nr:hypothetical protein N7541_008050 [Penicillium brevicompactum]